MEKVYRTSLLFLAACVASRMGVRAHAEVGDVYELRSNFSTTNNPNTTPLGGTWSFRNDADESLLEQADNPIGFVPSPGWDLLGGSGVPAIWRDFVTLITSVPFDPTVVGTHGDLLVRWTSAETGFAHVTGFYFEDDHNPPPQRILGYVLEKNGTELDRQAAVTSSTKMHFDETISIAPGDNIDLRILGNFPGATTMFPGFGGLSQRIEIVTAPAGIDGDYNDNGSVDAADYAVWRDTLGQSVTLPHDPTPGSVTSEDYTVWTANFGKPAAGVGSALDNSAVPEPGALILLFVGTIAVRLSRPRR